MPLRVLRPSDIAAVEDWLPPLAVSLGVARWSKANALSSAVGDQTALLYVDAAGDAFLSYVERKAPTRFAKVDLVAVPPHLRRLGIGGRAVLALEDRLRARHTRIRVRVPSVSGLALYFWLRLGYRPLLRTAWPSSQGTSIWMERRLS